LEDIGDWFVKYYPSILITIFITAVFYLIFYLAKKQILRIKNKGRINEGTSKSFTNLVKIACIILGLTAIGIQYREELGMFANVFSVAGGTVLGFAAINTLGNLIAGMIVMMTKPFAVGDRIEYKGRLADVKEIKLIYTVMEDIDGVKISVPNQKLLKEEIKNYGKDKILRREIFVTPGFDVEPGIVEEALIEATQEFKSILKFPEPRVDLYEFQDFAIKYRLIVFINNSRIIPKFDHQLRRQVFFTCRKRGVDLSTPHIIINPSKENKYKPYEDQNNLQNNETTNEIDEIV